MSAVTKETESNDTATPRGRLELHCDQAIVERFNRTLAERLFGRQYAVDMRWPEGPRSIACVEKAFPGRGCFEKLNHMADWEKSHRRNQRQNSCCRADNILFET